MLKDIFNVVKNIGNFFTSIVDFVIDFFSDLVYVIELLAETVVNIPQYLGFFPSVIVSAVVSLVAIAVIFKVLGREG